jgi:methyltransferase
MTALYWILLIISLQRLAELIYAQKNTNRLLSRGGVEIGRGHYPLFILLHGGWLLAMLLFIPAHTRPIWSLIGIMLVLQGLRFWVVYTLGQYWTTRIITVPGAPVVRRGPYLYVRHPNYLVVIAEIAVLPLAFAASPAGWVIAIVFSTLNLMLLKHRIAVEDGALAPRRAY